MWLVQLQCSIMKFEVRNRTFLISWRGFVQGFVLLPWLHCEALHQTKPPRARSYGVGPDSLGGISSSFHVHGKEGLISVSDECWMVSSSFVKRTFRMRSVCCLQRFLMSILPRSASAAFPQRPGLICGSSLATDGTDESSDSKVLKLKLDFVMALDD